MNLKELVDQYGALKPDYYLPLYEQAFTSIRKQPLSILEIGVAAGGSLRAWADFFFNSAIAGIDLKVPSGDFGKRIKIFQGDQTDKEFLKHVVQAAGPFDIVIDDGSHRPSDWLTSFKELFPYVKPGGFYVIEDLMAPTHPGWDVKERDYIEPCMIELCRPLLAQLEAQGEFEWIVLRPHILFSKKWKG